jgi:hypothetical protein
MLQPILWGVLLPGMVSLFVWAAIVRPWVRCAPPRAGGSLAVAAGFLAGHYGIGAPLTGADVVAWLPYVAGFAGIAGLACAWAVERPAVSWLLFISVSLGVSLLLIWPLAKNNSILEGMRDVAVAGTLFLLCWRAGASRGSRVETFSPAFFLWLSASAAAGLFVISGNLLIGQLSGALAAGIAPGVLWGLRRSNHALHPGECTAYFIIYNALILVAHFYSDLPVETAVGLGLAPIAALAPALPVRGAGIAMRTLLLATCVLAAWYFIPATESSGY